MIRVWRLSGIFGGRVVKIPRSTLAAQIKRRFRCFGARLKIIAIPVEKAIVSEVEVCVLILLLEDVCLSFRRWTNTLRLK